MLAEIEACSYRNKTPQETEAHIAPVLKKYLNLSSNSSATGGVVSQQLKNERQKDHYSHFILRLAFSATEELRHRFVRAETMLFKFRFQKDDSKERRAFIESLNLNWESVSEEERSELAEQLVTSTPGLRRAEDEAWFKVDWEKVPELIERRAVFIRKGKAYVPQREQLSMIIADFTARLEKAMEVCTDLNARDLYAQSNLVDKPRVTPSG